MKLRLKDYGFETKTDREVEVQFREIEHYLADCGDNVNGNPWRAYEVLIGGEVVGRVEQVTKSTDSPISGTRLRRVGRGKLAWAWTRPRTKADGSGLGPVNNYPGLYRSSRINAVADMLGYSEAVKL